MYLTINNSYYDIFYKLKDVLLFTRNIFLTLYVCQSQLINILYKWSFLFIFLIGLKFNL